MPYKSESMLMGGDASNDTSTQLCFNPPEGPFDASNVVKGTIAHANDEDWIAIKLTEGNTYTITVGGGDDGDDDTMNDLNDSVLKLMDSKGGLIDMNDDTDPAKGKLGSTLKFTPEAGSGTQVYFISVSGYTGNPGANNTGAYTVKVAETAVLPTGEGADIEGTDMADKLTGTADGESIAGLGGDDTIYGGAGDDSLSGGGGNDLLMGGAGADTLKGGEHTHDDMGKGGDTITYKYSPMGVTINLQTGTASGGDAAGDTLGDDIENVIGSAHDDVLTGTDHVNTGNWLWGLDGNDTLSGREGDDKLFGGAGDDSLDGGDEDDTLEGGPGADVLTGGRGADTASYAGSMMGVTVRLHASQAMGGDAEGDTWGDTTTEEYSVPAEDPEDPPVIMTETVPDIVHLTGSHMADILAGDSRDNTIKGNGGDDKLYGGPGGGDDMLMGGGGADMLFGGRGNDDLHGGAGDDMLNGGSGDDLYYGGAGSDIIYDTVDKGATEARIISGAAMADDPMTTDFNEMTGNAMGENDTLSYAKNKEAVTIDLEAGSARFISIETLIGTDEDDTLTGTNAASETIEGGDGADTLNGGDGQSDTVSYENSDRRVRVDLEAGGTTEASVSGGHATGDTVTNFENVRGSDFGDILEAIDGAADTVGSTLWGLGGDDTLVGKAGNDTIEGGAGADEVDGGATQASTGAESGESNTLSYAGSDAGVTVNLATSTASGGHAQGDEIETYEYNDTKGTADTDDDEDIDVSTFVNLTGSMHNDHLTGDRFDNSLTGGAGDDTLRSDAGADTLNGGPGADRLDGGSSLSAGAATPDTADDVQHEDWAVYRGAMAGVMVNLNNGSGTGGEAMGDTLKNIELIWGSTHGDTFIASEGVDIIHGDGGSDTVSYEASKHKVTVTLTTEDDTTQFTAGDSTATPPTMDMFNSPAQTVVDSWRGDTTTGRPTTLAEADDSDPATKSYAEGDVLASIENVTGSRNDDTITGDAVPNVLKGGAGNDTLSGGGEDDKLYGEAGRDTLNGDAGADMLMGGAGNDDLNGGADADTLIGGAGNDDLDGGAGIDTFVFAPGNGDDVIVDDTDAFDATATTGDKIDLSAFNIRAADLAGLISLRVGNAVINLSDYGGGTITIQGITDLDTFEITGATGNEDNGMIDNISLRLDLNGDGDYTDTGESDGLFIL